MTTVFALFAQCSRCIGKPPGYERFVRAVRPPERIDPVVEMALRLEGASFVLRPAIPLDWNLFFFGTYEPELRRVIRRVLRPGAVAVDVGANTGWHTMLMAHLTGGTGRVLAFEPNPSVLERLRSTLEANGARQVDIHPVALSARRERLSFFAPPSDARASGDGHVVRRESGNREHIVVVEAETLDAVAEAAGVGRLDLIKIDVEGYEWQVLQGARKAIVRHRPHVLFEHNAEYIGRGGGTAEAMHQYFSSLGYALFELRHWHRRKLSRGSWPRSCNIWAAPE